MVNDIVLPVVMAGECGSIQDSEGRVIVQRPLFISEDSVEQWLSDASHIIEALNLAGFDDEEWDGVHDS